MKSIFKNRFFLPIAMLLAVMGTIVGLSVNSPQASASSHCVTQSGQRTVTRYGDYIGTYRFFQTLKQGNSGSCVQALQNLSNIYCTPETKLDVDGRFGPLTYRATKSIQAYFASHQVRVNGSSIIVDGIAGPQTWSILQAFRFGPSGYVNCRS